MTCFPRSSPCFPSNFGTSKGSSVGMGGQFGPCVIESLLIDLNRRDLRMLKMKLESCLPSKNYFEQLYVKGFLDEGGYLSENHVDS